MRYINLSIINFLGILYGMNFTFLFRNKPGRHSEAK